MRMNRVLIGKAYPALDPIVVTSGAAQAFAHATRADVAAYTGPAAVVPPMLAASLAMGAWSAPLLDPTLGLEFMRLTHATQEMEFLAPLHPGDALRCIPTIVNIMDTALGETITIRVTVANQHDTTVLVAQSTLLAREPHKKDRFSTTADGATEACTASPPTWVYTEPLEAELGMRYAHASGDHNPIHLDHDVATLAGLPGPILHGMCAVALVHNACARHAGGDPARVRRLSAHLARPILLGDALTVEARGPSHGPWQLEARDAGGSVVLSDGFAVLS